MARTEGQWKKGISLITPAENVPVLLRNEYLNFGGTTIGESGYGIRDNSGTLQFKNDSGSWTNFGAGGGAATFLDLTDTPSAYTGQAGKFPKVNASEDALEFVAIPGGGDMLASTYDPVGGAKQVAFAADLGTAALADTTDFAPALGTDDNYVTDAEKTLIGTIASKGNVSKVGTPVNNQVGVWTGDGTIEGDTKLTYDGVSLDVKATTDSGAVTPLIVQGDRATPTANDEVIIEMKLSDSAGNQDTMGTIRTQALDVTSTSEDSQIKFGTMLAGTLASRVAITSTTIQPNTDDAISLGNATTNRFSDLFLAEGAVINWDNGDATLTQTGNVVKLAGASLETDGVIELGHASDTTIARVSAGVVSIEGNNIVTANMAAIISSGAGAPSSTPTKVGDIYIDTTGDDAYIAVGTDSSADWEKSNLSGGGIANIVEDITPQLGGDLDANGKNITDIHELRIDSSPDTDDTANGPTTDSKNAGATISAFEAVYMASDGEWAKTDASATATADKALAIALAAGTDGNAMKVALPGAFIRNDDWNWTVGGAVYLSETAGALTQTAPTTADAVVRVVGYAYTADVLWFMPETGVVHA